MSAAFDVVVAGGGLAGSTAARLLAERGLSVLMVERKNAPGDFNYCAEAVSARSVAPFVRLSSDLVAAPIDGGILAGPGGERCRMHWPGVGFMLHRERLMASCFEAAIAAGATGRLGATVVAVERDAAGRLAAVRVGEAGAERIGCRALLCADGIASAVGRMAGVDSVLDPSQILICAQYRLSGVEVEPGFPEFWIGDVHAPGGYAWVFPKGPGEANVGLAMVATATSARSRTATQWLKQFRKKRFQSTGKIESYITGGIPMLLRPGPSAAQAVVLAGDAARSADPLSAAGIAEAMASAATAAAVLAAALADGDLSAARLATADRLYRQEHPRLAVMARIRRVFQRLDDRGKAALVMACRAAFHEARIDDMDPLKMFVALLRASPRLVGYAHHVLPRVGRQAS
jgi:digeranylgeranylglycerophospholipid reductase